MVKVAVNPGACIGAGQCEVIAEDTFLLDEETVVAGVVGEGMLPRGQAQDAVNACPGGAISIVRTEHDEGS